LSREACSHKVKNSRTFPYSTPVRQKSLWSQNFKRKSRHRNQTGFYLQRILPALAFSKHFDLPNRLWILNDLPTRNMFILRLLFIFEFKFRKPILLTNWESILVTTQLFSWKNKECLGFCGQDCAGGVFGQDCST
jgi:hypothetical protein